ncbi:unnamed protein product [Heterobilharzia americana]|nr:unnamed protein product [Heterobilharzia americana]
MRESSRMRLNPARSTESRHAHTTNAEGLEGRGGACRLEEGLPGQAPEEGGPQCLQELAWNHATVKQNIRPHHPVDTKRCAGFKTTTRTGWLPSGSTNHVRTKLQRNASYHHRTKYRMAVNSPPYLNFIHFEKAFDNVD